MKQNRDLKKLVGNIATSSSVLKDFNEYVRNKINPNLPEGVDILEAKEAIPVIEGEELKYIISVGSIKTTEESRKKTNPLDYLDIILEGYKKYREIDLRIKKTEWDLIF